MFLFLIFSTDVLAEILSPHAVYREAVGVGADAGVAAVVAEAVAVVVGSLTVPVPTPTHNASSLHLFITTWLNRCHSHVWVIL